MRLKQGVNQVKVMKKTIAAMMKRLRRKKRNITPNDLIN